MIYEEELNVFDETIPVIVKGDRGDKLVMGEGQIRNTLASALDNNPRLLLNSKQFNKAIRAYLHNLSQNPIDVTPALGRSYAVATPASGSATGLTLTFVESNVTISNGSLITVYFEEHAPAGAFFIYNGNNYPIKFRDAAIDSDTIIDDGNVVTFMYDGTCFRFVNNDDFSSDIVGITPVTGRGEYELNGNILDFSDLIDRDDPFVPDISYLTDENLFLYIDHIKDQSYEKLPVATHDLKGIHNLLYLFTYDVEFGFKEPESPSVYKSTLIGWTTIEAGDQVIGRLVIPHDDAMLAKLRNMGSLADSSVSPPEDGYHFEFIKMVGYELKHEPEVRPDTGEVTPNHPAEIYDASKGYEEVDTFFASDAYPNSDVVQGKWNTILAVRLHNPYDFDLEYSKCSLVAKYMVAVVENVDSARVISSVTVSDTVGYGVKDNYKVGDTLNITGRYIDVNYEDGHVVTMSFVEATQAGKLMINPTLLDTQCYQTITLTYHEGSDNFYATYDVWVGYWIATSVDILQMPYKKTYMAGEEPDYEGLVINVYMAGRSYKTVRYIYGVDWDTERLNVISPSFDTVGQKTITVVYSEFPDDQHQVRVYETFKVDVLEIATMQMSDEMDQDAVSIYKTGDELLTRGRYVDFTFTDGTSRTERLDDLLQQSGYSISPGMLVNRTYQTVRLMYKQNQTTTWYAYFDVWVGYNVPVRLVITRDPNKYEYNVGETFDASGLEVGVVFYDGRNESPYYTYDYPNGWDTDYLSMNTPDLSTPGTKIVTVKYAERPDGIHKVTVQDYVYINVY